MATHVQYAARSGLSGDTIPRGALDDGNTVAVASVATAHSVFPQDGMGRPMGHLDQPPVAACLQVIEDC